MILTNKYGKCSIYILFNAILFNFMMTSVANSASYDGLYNNLPAIALNQSGFVLKGSKEKRILFKKAYTIEFYLKDNVPPEAILTDVGKGILFKCHTYVPKEKLRGLISQWIKSNIDDPTYIALEDRFRQLYTMMTDLQPGDQLRITYLPDCGTQIYVNQQLLGGIHGEDFAATLFSIWVGENPIDESMKRKLLAYHYTS